jgi:peptidoglycan/LPS O-acetylase OafA/YrhL
MRPNAAVLGDDELKPAAEDVAGQADGDPAPDTKPSAYRADIDGLRAVAVASVITYHMEHAWLPGGFTGVDVFFVISGFVVTGSLLGGSRQRSVGSLLAHFYARRVKRLMPALLLTVACAGVGTALIVPTSAVDRASYFLTMELAVLGTSNNQFAALETGYFDEGAGSLELNPMTRKRLRIESYLEPCTHDSLSPDTS